MTKCNPIVIEGFASTPAKDRDGDIITPQAFGNLFEFIRRPELRLNHRKEANCEVGRVTELKVSDAGLWIRAQLFEDCDDIVERVNSGELYGFSVGFKRAERSIDAQTGVSYLVNIILAEISLSCDPKNPETGFVFASPSVPSADIRNPNFRAKLYWSNEWLRRQANEIGYLSRLLAL